MAEQHDRYRLKDAETSFYDDETGFTVTRDQEAEIGKTMGKKTLAMIRGGGLIKVDSSAAQGDSKPAGEGGGAQKPSAQPKSGPIGEDFPHAKLLAENGITTYAPLHKLNTQQIVGLKGIGEKKAEEIEKALGR